MSEEKRYKTSLYVARVPENVRIPTLKEIRDVLIKCIESRKDKLSVNIDKNLETFYFKSTTIDFRVRTLLPDKKILIAFKPTGRDISKWKRERVKGAAIETLEFCDALGENFDITVRNVSLEFNRVYLRDEVFADFKVEDEFHGKTYNYEDFEKNRYSLSNTILQKLPEALKDKIAWIFCDPQVGKVGKDLEQFVRKYLGCKVLGPIPSVGLLEEHTQTIIKDHSEEKYIVFIVGTRIVEEFYKREKIWLNQHCIANQFIRPQTTQKIDCFPGVKCNFLIEISKKIGIKTFRLLPPKNFDNVAFLCLSDIKSGIGKLFGILVSYSSETAREKDEKLYIYKDISFRSSKYKIWFDEREAIVKLGEKILTLGLPSDFSIDIILTKEWRKNNLKELLNILQRNGVVVNSVYYISSKTSRFVSKHLFEQNVPGYPIISFGTSGFVFPVNRVRIYHTLFPLYIRLYHPDRNLEKDDFLKILWLVKRRIYRIQELKVTKLPEPMYIFSGVRKLWLPEIEATLEIPLRLLI